MIEITEIAANKVKEIMASQNQENSVLRIYMSGFGCSGPNLGMALDEAAKPEDNVDEGYGVTIVSEQQIAQFVKGLVINYVEDEYNGGFELKSPHQQGASCGGGCSHCG